MEGSDIVIWLTFIATTFITQITFLNMLIAIMGDTFARVSEVKEQSALNEKIKILSDFVIIVSRESIEAGNLSRFLFAIMPKSMASDESGNWEGTVTQLKKTIEKSMQSVKQTVTRSNASISSEVKAVTTRLSALDDKITNMQNKFQQVPTMSDIERLFKSA